MEAPRKKLKCCKVLYDTLSDMRKKHLKRFKAGHTSTSVSLLYLDILAESKNMLMNVSNLVKTSRAFIASQLALK